MARLIERGGDRAGRWHGLRPETTTIGRDGENDVVLLDERISRHHVRISWDGKQYMLDDLGSRNGTTVNRQPVSGPRPLRHGDVISLGGSTLFFDAAEDTVLEGAGEASGALRIEPATAEVWLGEERVPLTAKEYQAVLVLYRKSGGLVSKEELATAVWPEYHGGVGDYNIEQLISRLRRKLEPEPSQPHYLLTVRSLGYRLVLQ